MQAVQTIHLRNEFYKDRYRQARLLAILLLVLNIILFSLLSYVYLSPKTAFYFPATNDFRLINVHPLTDPVIDDQQVLQWAGIAVQKAYNVDYIHWKKQLEYASAGFTNSGWDQFVKKFKQSNNLSTILKQHMVTDTTLSGAPELLQKGVLGSKYYAWKIRIPVLVSYISDQQTIKMPLSVTLLVIRQPVASYPDRVAINNFVASTQNS